MKARKAIAMGLIAAMSVGVLAGCGGDKKEEGKETAVYSGDIEPSARGFRATLTDE